jgi:hypothetical protein|tara:strand:- start:43 stop:252 length:210 start_codon:yes stop_codon:yes gene_type:complete
MPIKYDYFAKENVAINCSISLDRLELIMRFIETHKDNETTEPNSIKLALNELKEVNNRANEIIQMYGEK